MSCRKRPKDSSDWLSDIFYTILTRFPEALSSVEEQGTRVATSPYTRAIQNKRLLSMNNMIVDPLSCRGSVRSVAEEIPCSNRVRCTWQSRGAMIERLLSAEETARYLGIKKGTLYVWARSGKIPSVKIGTRLLFDVRDLEELIERQKRAPLSDTGR